MANHLKCNVTNCFANQCGSICSCLVEHTDTKECAFFKTRDQVDEERIKAHQHLIDIGRTDLIKKYEYNPYRRGQW